MSIYLVTGPDGFLGYHVVKLLNDRGVKPRVLLSTESADSSPGVKCLRRLDVDVVAGSVVDLESLHAACTGVETVLHLKFEIHMGEGKQVEESLRRVNVEGTRNVLNAAAEAGVARVVVSSSALAVGLNPQPQPLDETADWEMFRFRLPYAMSRREVEEEGLARPGGEGKTTICVVNPSFTMGPEDYVGAPANKLAMKMCEPGFRLNAPIGYGILDVRDYADGVLRAVEHGQDGQRYILSGENINTRQLLQEVTSVVSVKPARWLFTIRKWMLYPVIKLLGVWSRLRGKPPKVSASLLQLWGRNAWYDVSLARDQLGWKPRPLSETVRDSVAWFRDHRQEQ